MKIFAGLLIALCLVGAQPSNQPKNEEIKSLYVSNYENVLGTSLEFKFTSLSETEADKAEQAALLEINRLAKILSAYDKSSEFNNWLAQGTNKPVKVSAELFDMLALFADWKQRTNGALDASATVAVNLWKEAAAKNKLPTSAEIGNAAKTMQQTHYKLDETAMTATRLTNVPLVMNTFAKSYIINSACDAALSASNINAVVVNIGGDLVIKGDVNDAVNVTNPLANAENDAPLAYLSVSNKAVATSGNYRRGEQIGNKWYSHIIDPRTAMPVEGVISATVIAPNATDAGVLATAFNVLSVKEGEALAATIKGADYLIITKDGKRIESKNWHNYVAKPLEKEVTTIAGIGNKAEKLWDAKYELAINFQFNRIEGNSHRPFAAIWVENEKKEAVRNLALWYNKTKWIPDLRNWYRINGERFKANKDNYASATGATRNPGKYTIKWDGKDDKGAFVPQGKYTIILETSKEAGTDEIIRQQMEFKKTAKKATNAGNVEISNVTFDFYKK